VTPGTAWTATSAHSVPDSSDPLPLHLVFGGTFDPVHKGHLLAADAVLQALAPDDFRFLPAGDPPHRPGTFAAPEHRLNMLRIALDGKPGMQIDEREMQRSGPSYMSLTLASLREEFPADSLALLVGQDAANDLDRWHDWRRLLRLAHLVIISRPDRPAAYSARLETFLEERVVESPAALRGAPAGSVLYLAVPPVPVSSTGLRDRIDAPGALRLQVPAPVADYIEAHDLYR